MSRPAKLKDKLPHAFVLEALAPLNPEVRRMFSGFAVYLGYRIVCMLLPVSRQTARNLTPWTTDIWCADCHRPLPEGKSLLYVKS